jgi:hypothetical protein
MAEIQCGNNDHRWLIDFEFTNMHLLTIRIDVDVSCKAAQISQRAIHTRWLGALGLIRLLFCFQLMMVFGLITDSEWASGLDLDTTITESTYSGFNADPRSRRSCIILKHTFEAWGLGKCKRWDGEKNRFIQLWLWQQSFGWKFEYAVYAMVGRHSTDLLLYKCPAWITDGARVVQKSAETVWSSQKESDASYM